MNRGANGRIALAAGIVTVWIVELDRAGRKRYFG